jgi:hydrogenase-4 component F
MVGTLAIVGSPPFGPFLSEFTVLKGMIDSHRALVAVWYLSALAIVFVAMSAVVIGIVYGRPARDETQPEPLREGGWPDPPRRGGWAGESWWSVLPPLLLGVAVLVLGLYLPQGLCDFLHRAAQAVGAE